MITTCVCELADTDPAAAEALRQRPRDLIGVQRLSADRRDAVEGAIAV